MRRTRAHEELLLQHFSAYLSDPLSSSFFAPQEDEDDWHNANQETYCNLRICRHTAALEALTITIDVNAYIQYFDFDGIYP